MESTGTIYHRSFQPEATSTLPNVNNPSEGQQLGSPEMAVKKGQVRIGILNIMVRYREVAENLHAVAKDNNAMRLDIILVMETRIGSE